jgi:hypothetical protein
MKLYLLAGPVLLGLVGWGALGGFETPPITSVEGEMLRTSPELRRGAQAYSDCIWKPYKIHKTRRATIVGTCDLEAIEEESNTAARSDWGAAYRRLRDSRNWAVTPEAQAARQAFQAHVTRLSKDNALGYCAPQVTYAFFFGKNGPHSQLLFQGLRCEKGSTVPADKPAEADTSASVHSRQIGWG